MKRRIILLVIITANAILPGFSNNNFETAARESTTLVKCATPEFSDAFRFSKVVFVGKVLSVKEKDNKKIFEFSVEKSWKGIRKKKVEVGFYETTRYPAWYQVGKKYLVYARSEDDGSLVDGRCSRSREIGDYFIAGDLKKLGKLKIIR